MMPIASSASGTGPAADGNLRLIEDHRHGATSPKCCTREMPCRVVTSERRQVPFLRACAAALLCALLAGCAEADTHTAPEADDSHQQSGVVLSADPADDRAYPAAILTGRLTLKDGCLALDGFPTLWPAGSDWDEENASVVLPDGSRLATGDRVEVGGGLVPPSVASNYSVTAQEPIDACMRSLGAQELALISGVVQ